MISGIRTHIFIGDMEILRCPRCRIESIRHRPLSRAALTLPDPDGKLYVSIIPDQEIEIRSGYRDEDPVSWKGLVTYIKYGTTKDQLQVVAVGKNEKLLSSVFISQAWENETPEAIIKYAVSKAGLSCGRIDSPGVIIPRYCAATIPVWQVSRQCAHTCQKSFDIDMSKWALWLGQDDKVNWGDFDEPAVSAGVPVIATGAGLIRHLPSQAQAQKELNMVETFLLPGFMHSMQFHLIDTRRGIDDTFRALQIAHEILPNSARTYISYGNEYEKY